MIHQVKVVGLAPHPLLARVLMQRVHKTFILQRFQWERHFTPDGQQYFDVTLEYMDMGHTGIPLAKAADRLEMLQLGLLPLDKLKSEGAAK